MTHTDLQPNAMDEVLSVLANERETHFKSGVIRVKGLSLPAKRFLLREGYLTKLPNGKYGHGRFGVGYDGSFFSQDWRFLPIEVIWHVAEPTLDETGHAGHSIVGNKRWAMLNLDHVRSGDDEGRSARNEEEIWNVLAELAAYGFIWFQSGGTIWAIQKRYDSSALNR